MDFSGIRGQKEVIESLKNSIESDRVGHAYIFDGPRGIGKKTVAGIFAGMLLCSEQNAKGSCGRCPSCRMLENASNPDFVKIGQSSEANILIEEIRRLQSDIIVKPLYSRRKVYLIIDAERMTVQAQNCLLKILEEPPGYAIIILTTHNRNALLETIRSRALKYSFRKNTYDEVHGLLEERFGKNLEGMDFITSFSDGIIGNALELAGSEEFSSIRDKTTGILEKLTKGRLEDIFDIYGFFEENRDSVDNILNIMLLLYRDIMVLKETGNEILLINSDKKDIILRNARGLSTSKLLRNMGVIEQTARSIKQNANYQLSIEVMLMKLQEEGA